MKASLLFWLLPGFICLGLLIILRVFSSHMVVDHALGTVLSFGWGCCMCAALLVHFDVSLGIRSLWRVFIVAIGAIAALLASLTLGVGVLTAKSSAELILFFALQLPIIGFGLWRLRRRSITPNQALNTDAPKDGAPVS